jgi:AcrR family transcriptional regulator
MTRGLTEVHAMTAGRKALKSMTKRNQRAPVDRVRAPEQSRSRASMEALLEIGRRLIEERGIDDCSMSDIAAAAGSSIGSLYFRFGNREQFIDEVMQRQLDKAQAEYDQTLVEIAASAAAPRDVVEAIVRWVVRLFRQNQGLLRVQLRRSLESPQTWRPYREAGQRIVDGAIGLLERFPEVQMDPDWKLHVRIAMQMTFGTLNNILINRPGSLEMDDDTTGVELGRAAVRYLRLESVEASKAKPASVSKRRESRVREVRKEGEGRT